MYFLLEKSFIMSGGRGGSPIIHSVLLFHCFRSFFSKILFWSKSNENFSHPSQPSGRNRFHKRKTLLVRKNIVVLADLWREMILDFGSCLLVSCPVWDFTTSGGSLLWDGIFWHFSASNASILSFSGTSSRRDPEQQRRSYEKLMQEKWDDENPVRW